MKQVKFICIGLGMLSFMLLTNCGDAGVQIKVGGDYETVFNANQAGLEFLQSYSESASTTVNSEIREYGDFITQLEIKSFTITMKDFDNTVTGEIIIDLSGSTFSTDGSVTITDGAVIPLTPDQANGLEIASNRLQQGDVSIGLTLNTDSPIGDNAFDMNLAILAFATVQVDE
ncbi:hypothetical protein [Ekhidna sp.]|uniref:hypothetical protein n=1 Tax=Ekhidna sp. TaxID=2608089 RepID=UPI0032EEE3EE